MTVENTDNIKRVDGDGVTDEFTFNFRVLANADLKVYKVNSSNVATLQTEDTDYTLTLETDGEGGTVDFTIGTTPTASEDVLMRNVLSLTQTADLPTEGNFNEESVETALDRSRLIDIQQQEEIDRCLKLSFEDPENDSDFVGLFFTVSTAAARADKLLTFNATGDGVEASSLTDASLSTLAGISDDITTVAGISANVTTVAGISANVTTVAGISGNITTVAGISTEVSTVAGLDTEVAALYAIAADITTVANNVSGVNSFAERYRIAASDPATSLDEGDLVYNTTDNALKYYDGSSWNSVVPGITNIVEDTTPQLGGNLDVNGNSIVSVSNGNIPIAPNGTGKVILDGLSWPTADGTSGQFLTTDGAGNLSFGNAAGYENKGYRTNGYYVGVGYWITGTVVAVADTFYARPIVIGSTVTFNRVGVNVSSGAGNARIGLYEWEDGVPTNLITDFGVVDVSTGGTKELTINETLTPGVYGVAVVFSSTPTMSALDYDNDGWPAHFLGGTSYAGVALSATGTQTYGAMPSSAPTMTVGASKIVGTWFRKV